MAEERKIFTLTQLNLSLERHFWDNFSKRDFWITAEVIKINQKSGHFYLELADSVKDETTARSRAAIWASTYTKIVGEIGIKEFQGILQEGNKILMNVKIEYHKIYGMSLRVRNIDPNYSYGEIERKRQEVIKRLSKEGIFGNQKLLRLPTVIKRIALIGSPETSGFRDFMNELFNNHDFNNFKVKTFSVRVQGDAAVKDIVAAINEANLYDVEAIVMIRGGGSKMDLALFDDYKIAHAICHSRLPVLTGIGHETDEVVADLVARQFFITPTAVGKHIQYEIQSFREIMRSLHDKTIQKAQQLLGESKEEFTHYNNYLSHFSIQLIHSWRGLFQEIEFDVLTKGKTLLYASKDELANIGHRTYAQLQRLVQQEGSTLERFSDRILTLSKQQLELEKDVKLSMLLSKVQLYSQQVIEKEQIGLKNQEELLKLLDPRKILSAGYTISMIKDKDVKDINVEIGDEMKTLSSNYLITSKVISKEENEYGSN